MEDKSESCGEARRRNFELGGASRNRLESWGEESIYVMRRRARKKSWPPVLEEGSGEEGTMMKSMNPLHRSPWRGRMKLRRNEESTFLA